MRLVKSILDTRPCCEVERHLFLTLTQVCCGDGVQADDGLAEWEARLRGGPYRALGTGRGRQTVQHAVAHDSSAQGEEPVGAGEVKEQDVLKLLN